MRRQFDARLTVDACSIDQTNDGAVPAMARTTHKCGIVGDVLGEDDEDELAMETAQTREPGNDAGRRPLCGASSLAAR